MSDDLSPNADRYGFGGAPVVALERLAEASRPGDAVFFGVDTELGRRFGQGNPGAASFVRDRTLCMMPWTQACAGRCHDVGVVTAGQPEAAMREVTAIARYLAKIGRRPTLIGCDHTASLPAVLGTAAGAGPLPVYLYFDAHLDLGRHDQGVTLHNGNFIDRLLDSGQVGRVINVGARSWSRFDPAYRDVPGLTCIPGGVPAQSAAAVIEQLGVLRGTRLYVSIDADVLDPSAAPNVCCPEPFGLRPTELFAVCDWLGHACTVVGADLCEVVPKEPTLASEQALMRCLHALYPGGASQDPSLDGVIHNV